MKRKNKWLMQIIIPTTNYKFTIYDNGLVYGTNYNEKLFILNEEALNQIMAIGILQWKSLPPSDGKLSTLSNIKQGPDERDEDFVARLKTAVEKTIKSTEPAKIVLKQLAYEKL